jgi:hypothetical protein
MRLRQRLPPPHPAPPPRLRSDLRAECTGARARSASPPKRAHHAELLHVLGIASQPSATLPAVVADGSVEEESSSCAQATGARLARIDTL